ncbi:hypothetical protein FRB99_005778 [Tulasnella sp. 403]|nr:hypothetical protein FRB99_005778 [Tulasnella sp. 403]
MSYPSDVESYVDSYLVSPKTAFRPTDPPATAFKDPQYSIWLFTAKSIPRLLWKHPGAFRTHVEELPLLLFSASCADVPQWRLAYVALAYIAHAYIWGASAGPALDENPIDYEAGVDVLPPNVAIPLRHVADHLGVQPGLTFPALCTWNWQRRLPIVPGQADWAENLQPIFTFTGTPDEERFIISYLMVEGTGGAAMKSCFLASKAAGEHDNAKLQEALNELAAGIDKCRNELDTVNKVKPEIFRNRVKPYLVGFGATNSLPKGVFYRSSPEKLEKGEWLKLAGASTCQSSLYPMLDAFLGIVSTPETYHQHFEARQQQAMPRPHAQFIESISCLPSIKDYVEANPNDKTLSYAYIKAVASLDSFRQCHRSATKFIVGPCKRVALISEPDPVLQKVVVSEKWSAARAVPVGL